MTRRLSKWALELSILVIVWVAVSTWQAWDLVPANTPAPSFELRTLSGDRLSLASLRGKRVLLHFWATWCGVCRMEVSMLNAIHESLGPDDVLVTVVADADDAARVRRFAEERGIRYPVLLDDVGVVEAYRVDAFPTNYYLGRDGVIRGRTVGLSARWAMRARLWLLSS